MRITENGLQDNLTDPELNKLLISFVKENNPMGIKTLIEIGADPCARNLEDDSEETKDMRALTLALYLDYPLCVKELLDAGADLFDRDIMNTNKPALIEAVKNNNSQSIPTIVKHLEHIDMPCYHGFGNLLSIAATQKNKRAIDMLLSLGADVDGKCTIDDETIDYEYGVLNHIVMSNLSTNDKIDMITFMSSRGANPDGIFGEHIPYPYEIAAHHDLQLLQWFCSTNTDIELKGREAILAAAAFNNVEVVQWLAENEFNLNVKRKNGLTPIMLTALHNCKESAQILLSHNVKVDLDECLKIALENNHQDMVDFFLEAGASSEILESSKN